MAGGRKDRGLYDGRNVSGARMWLEVGATEDSMVDAMCKEQGCGWSRAFFIEFSLGGQCPKSALQMVKKGTLRIINAYLHNP